MSIARPFTERFGHVQYTVAKGRPDHWRISVVAGSTCEFPGCEVRGGYGVMVFDHCHRHGWVRGMLCSSCNVKVGRVEAVMTLDDVSVDLGTSGYARWLANCPDCPGEPGRRIPPRGPFAVGIPTPRARKPIPVNPGAPVARPGARIAHLPATAMATLCGRVADGMTAAAELPVCRVCTARARPDSAVH